MEVGRGEIVCVAGANGTGKSSLLKSIAGLERPRSGTSFLFRKAADREALLHRVFQLFPRLAERFDQWAETLSGGEQRMPRAAHPTGTRGPLGQIWEAKEDANTVVDYCTPCRPSPLGQVGMESR